jgi:hypothetical protein
MAWWLARIFDLKCKGKVDNALVQMDLKYDYQSYTRTMTSVQ